MDLTNKPAPKKQFLPMIGIGLTFVLAGVAMATALRLYQLRAPNAPESQPAAQSSLTTTTTNPLFETAACSVLTFSIATPTPTGTATATPTGTPTATPTSTATATPTSTATATPTSTATATATPTSTATSTPRITTTTPTSTPTELPATGVSIPTIMVMAAGLLLLTMAALLVI